MELAFNNYPKALQLHWRDDGKIHLRALRLDDGDMVERKGGEVVVGWPHTYANQFPFDGYKNMPSGMVTACFSRDIIWELFPVLSEGEKPKQGTDLVKDWIIGRGESRQNNIQNKAAKRGMEAVSKYLGIAIIIITAAMALRALIFRG
jgi:hypothetical protein